MGIRIAENPQILKDIASNFKSGIKGIAERIRTGKISCIPAPGCGCKNSFTPTTLIRTLNGLVAISALALGTPVLA